MAVIFHSLQDLYIDRPLPYLIGSKLFMEQEDVGLGELSSEGILLCQIFLLLLTFISFYFKIISNFTLMLSEQYKELIYTLHSGLPVVNFPSHLFDFSLSIHNIFF